VAPLEHGEPDRRGRKALKSAAHPKQILTHSDKVFVPPSARKNRPSLTATRQTQR